jgi:phosphoglycerate-specific signal transduction histidine kinase
LQQQAQELARANAELAREIGERQRVEAALQEAKEVAEAANRAKGEFLAPVAMFRSSP